MKELTFDEFKNAVRKITSKRETKIKNSYGIYDGYKYYRKNKDKSKEYILTESQYFLITREVNKILKELFLNGEDIKFPHNMGHLSIKKYDTSPKFINGKLKTNKFVDWNKTLELWYEDEEANDNKIVVYFDNNESFKIHYRKNKAKFKNKSYYKFMPNRQLKRELSNNIKENKIDAFI